MTLMLKPRIENCSINSLGLGHSTVLNLLLLDPIKDVLCCWLDMNTEDFRNYKGGKCGCFQTTSILTL